MAEDYSYIGSGRTYVREVGTTGPRIDIGNCSALSFSPQEEELTLRDHMNPGGGTRNEVRRLTGVETSMTMHDLSPGNLQRALRGTATAIEAGTVTEEEVVAQVGGFIPLEFLPLAVTSVFDLETPAMEYDEGVDYEVRSGGIFIPEGSAIAAPTVTDGVAEPNVGVAYSYGDQDKVEALTETGKIYEMVFAGLNEARSGKQVRVQAYRVSQGLLQQLALLGEDYGAGEVTGKLLSDPTKSGTGVSRYFKAEMER